MYKNSFELQVLVNGKPVKETSFQGKSFIEARRGTQYTLRLKNNTHRRGLAVFSVDGVDVLKGKKASEASSGYVIDSYSSIEIKGFRVDDDNVSAFKFDDKQKSYAAVVGAKTKSGGKEKTTKNSGVIGVKVTLEKEFEYPKFPQFTYTAPVNFPNNAFSGVNFSLPLSGCIINAFHVGSSLDNNVQDMSSYSSFGDTDTISYTSRGLLGNSGPQGSQGLTSLRSRAGGCSAGPVAAAAVPNFTLGTTWGEKIEDSVRKVSFDSSDESFDMVIYYGERHELEDFGVDFSPKKKVTEDKEDWPQAFGESEYCPIPSYK